MFRESMRMAWASLLANKMRSLLTMLGIIVGIGAVIAIVGVGDGAKDLIMGEFEGIGASSIIISASSSDAQDQDMITARDIEDIRNLDDVRLVSPSVYGFGYVRYYARERQVTFYGMDQDYAPLASLKVLNGRSLTHTELASKQPVALIEKNSAAQLFGNSDPIGETVEIISRGKKQTFTIMGVIETSASTFMGMTPSEAEQEMPLTLYLPLQVAQELGRRRDTFYMIMVMADDPNLLEQTGNQVLRLLETNHNNSDRKVYQKQNVTELLDQANRIIDIVTTAISAIAALSLLVGGIGVMNIMLVSVTERTREIGIRKALGATIGDIMFQFMTESVILTFVGGAIGIIFGLGASLMMGKVLGFKASISIVAIIVALIFSSGVGLFFGIYPARKASMLNPIDALRNE
ncbi:MAG: FtsX-like permease family protein [Clostridiaceae bacterium]|jgi:putative ABC transport system permease protein|nr:FtsX-like permease family protein [Clostridiaceae bacterium]